MNPIADRFLNAFRSRAACCKALLDLSARQQSLIEESDYSSLVDLLGHKQQLVDELTQRNFEGNDLWVAWQHQRTSLVETERQRCERVLDETDLLLKQLMELELSSTSELSSRKDVVQSALAEVHQGGQAAFAYQSPDEVPVSRRLDLDL